MDIDGYYIELVVNVIYGVIWYQWGKRVVTYLQDVPQQEWHVLSKSTKEKEMIDLSEVDQLTKDEKNVADNGRESV